MQNQEEPAIQNWADFIDALSTFHPPWPARVKRFAKRSLDEEIGTQDDNSPRRLQESPEL